MSSPGALNQSQIGPGLVLSYILANAGNVTFDAKSQNAGWAARFVAQSTKDIKSVIISWATVTTAGTVQLRIETVDANGEPTGNLYDANATLDFTPSAGTQTLTFATTPTTGLTVGTNYCVLLLTTVAGTAHTLNSHTTLSVVSTYTSIVLSAADISTRTSIAEVASAVPICGLIMDDDTYECPWGGPFAGSASTSYAYDTNIVGAKFVIANTFTVSGIYCIMAKAGTPAGDVTVSLRDSSNNVITGTEKVLIKEIITVGSALKRSMILFSSPVELTAGTYYFVMKSPSSASTAHAWGLRTYAFLSSSLVAANFYIVTNSSDTIVGATVSSTHQAPVWLIIDSSTAPAGGGGLLAHSGMTGGING